MLLPCVHNSTQFYGYITARFKLYYCQGIIISRRGKVIFNYFKEGLLITTAEAQEGIHCLSNLKAPTELEAIL